MHSTATDSVPGDRPDRVVFVEVSRPGSDAEIARADLAVADVLRASAWEFAGAHDVQQTVFCLAMFVFSGATDAQIADYLRARDRPPLAPSRPRRSEEDYTAAARAVRIAFGHASGLTPLTGHSTAGSAHHPRP